MFEAEDGTLFIIRSARSRDEADARVTAAGVDSLFKGQTKLDTPHLAIKYGPAKESTFWRT